MHSEDRTVATTAPYGIVAFAPNSWRGPWMNRQQLLSRLSRAVPVIYSNGNWFSWHRTDPGWRRAPVAGRFELLDGVWLDHPPKILMRWRRFAPWDRLVLGVQAQRLRRFLRAQGSGRVIAYAFHPMFTEDVEALKPDFRVYHAYDLYKSTPGWTEANVRREQLMVSRADLVVASSQVIADSLQADTATEVLVLPNGADVEAFVSAAHSACAVPDDLAKISHPRIGYTGNLNRKVDFPLVERIARSHVKWQFVFVGAMGSLDEITSPAVERCRGLPNVHFLGGKSHSELPAYVGAMDVNVMWYRRDRSVWTEGIYPLKLHEYLAAGRPVVAADIPSLREFKDVVALAADADEWTVCLRDALDGGGVGGEESRRAVAAQNDWDIRVAQLNQQLDIVAAR